MRSFLSTAALLLLRSIPSIEALGSDVHVLKADSFKPFISDYPIVLAEFYAPWCGHCKALAPEYEEAATSLKDNDDIKLAKIDCTEEASLCQEYGVEGYPTLKVFKGVESKPTPFTGPRKAASIVSFMKKQAMPAVSKVTVDSIEDFKKSDKIVIVGYYEDGDTSSNKEFFEIAEELRNDFVFGHADDASIAKTEGVKAPSVVLYKDFDEGKSVHDGAFTREEIDKFIKVASVPLVGEIGPDTYAGYMAAQLPLAYYFANTPEERKQFADDMKDIAKKLKGKLNIATIDAKQFGAHATNLNLSPDKFPSFGIQETVKNLKFPYDQEAEINPKNLGKFLDDFVAGKIKPSIKSEAVPEKQEGPVHILVANNWDEIVMDDDKDVLVEFYAPWCGHCKALAPKYDDLGALFFGKPDGKKVTIAKVDATLNDVPEEISGFPTIKLYPAGGKTNPIDFAGARTMEGLAEFIKESGKWKIDGLANVKTEDETEIPAAEEMGKVPPAASKKAEEVVDGAKETAEAAKEKAESVAESASSAASEAGATASSASEEAKESAKGAAQKVVEKVVEGAAAVKEAIDTLGGDGEGDAPDKHDEL